MKKWLIILTVIFVVGGITSATLAGYIYYNELKTYEDYDKRELRDAALENVYIKTSVPVEIHPTKGQPYVEFTQKYTDIVGFAPKYKLNIEEKEDTTYIDLQQIKDMSISLGVKEDKASLVVYLPEKDIKKLSVENSIYGYYYRTKQVIDLEKINIAELDLDVENSEMKLNGRYEKINISAHASTINMQSQIPAEVRISGVGKQNLSGQFKRIVIKDNAYEVNINSENESSVELECSSSQIRLEGKYEKIDVNCDNSTIDVRSESICKLSTNGRNNTINADGAFEVIRLEEDEANVEVKTTMIPKSIEMKGETDNSKFNLVLPSNISGYTLSCTSFREEYYNDYYTDKEYEENFYEINKRIEQECYFRSDFESIEKEENKGEIAYKYGDGKIPIALNVTRNVKLNINDGGYSSVAEVK